MLFFFWVSAAHFTHQFIDQLCRYQIVGKLIWLLVVVLGGKAWLNFVLAYCIITILILCLCIVFIFIFCSLFAIISLHCTCYSLCSSGLFAYRVSYRMAVRELDNSWSLRFETFNQSFLLMLIYSYVCWSHSKVNLVLFMFDIFMASYKWILIITYS